MKRQSFAVLKLQEIWPDLKYVQDAKKHLRIKIDQCDIDKAKRNDPMRCAIKIGTKRSIHCEDVAIGRSTAYIKYGVKAIRYIVPMGAQKELIAFDRGGTFIPGTYELKKPWAANTLKAMRNQGPHPTKEKGKEGKKSQIVNLNHSNRPRLQSN